MWYQFEGGESASTLRSAAMQDGLRCPDAAAEAVSIVYRRGELYEPLTHTTPLKLGTRVTRPSDEKSF